MPTSTSTEALLSRGRAVRQVAFSDIGSAFNFAQGVMAAAGSDAAHLGTFPNHLFEVMATKWNGHITTTRSHSGRELAVYHRQRHIYPQDREYLLERDPTAKLILKRVAQDSWWKLPRTYDEQIDSFFRTLRNLGFNAKAEAADIRQRLAGYSFLFIVAPGNTDMPLSRNAPWKGFDYIDGDNIVEGSIVYAKDKSHPLLKQHGIEWLDVKQADGDPVTIHGSRLIAFCEDVETRELPGGVPVLDVVHDDLWALRDVLFGQEQAQIQGDPIVVSVDLEANFATTPEADADINKEMAEMSLGHRQSFSPVEGLIIERLGSIKLDDPSHIIKALYSRISNGLLGFFPINMLVASSRGSEQVTDQDRMDYASNVTIRNEKFVLPILAHLLELGKWSGMVAKRAELPEMEWPELRILNPRERAYVESTKATTLLRASQAGYHPDPWVMRGMTPRPGGILPLQPTHPKDADLERERMEFEGENADKDREHESEEGDKERQNKKEVAKAKPKPKPASGGGSK